MDLETLIDKPIEELTIDEVRFLQSNIKNFIDKQTLFETNFGSLTLDEYSTIVITDEAITINSDHQNAIATDKIFKNFLVQSLIDATAARKIANEQKEVDLANRLIELNNA